MKIFSTANARFDGFDSAPPAPPELLSALDKDMLKFYFEHFSYFVYARYAPASETLTSALYAKCIAHLLTLNASSAPVLEASDLTNLYFNTDAVVLQKKKCKLRLNAPEESFPQLVARRFTEIKNAGKAETTYDFQLYLYITILHFCIWYYTEIISEPFRAAVKLPTPPSAPRSETYYCPVSAHTPTNYTLLVPAKDKPALRPRPGDDQDYVRTLKVDYTLPGRYELVPDSILPDLDFFGLQHRLPESVRDYITAAIKVYMTAERIKIREAFFETDSYLKCFAIETTAGNLVDYEGLGHVRHHIRETDRQSVVRIKRLLVKTFWKAVTELIEQDLRNLVSSFSDSSLGSDDSLSRDYVGFSRYGLGDGSDTVALFGEPNYGLLFFRYALNESTTTLWDLKVLDTLDKVRLLDARDLPGGSVCFFYVGLDNPFGPPFQEHAPRIVFHGHDLSGKELDNIAKDYVIRAEDIGDHQFKSDRVGFFPDSVQLSSFRVAGGTAATLAAELRTSDKGVPGHLQEEIVYLVFKHSIENPRKRKAASAIILSTNWTLPNNAFWKSKSERKQRILADNGVPAKDLAPLVRSLATTTNGLLILVDLSGLGVGSLLDLRASDGAEVGQSDDQRDNPVPDDIASENDFVRYAHGHVEYYPDPPGAGEDWLIFRVKGFVSPLPCTWESKLPPAQYDLVFDAVGQYLKDPAPEPRSYNCVLSSFRAFAMFAAMIEAIVRQAATMVGTGPNAISQQQSDALRMKLDDYVKLEARVEIVERADAPRSEAGRRVTKMVTDGTGVREVPVLVTWPLMKHFISDFLQ